MATPVEEITVGLPHEGPSLEDNQDFYEVNQYLLREVSILCRHLISTDSFEEFLHALLLGVGEMFGSAKVEVVIHDPIADLAGYLEDETQFAGRVRLTPDSVEVVSLHSDDPATYLVKAEMSRELGLIRGVDVADHVYVIPLVQGGVLVGSLHCGDTKLHTNATGDPVLMADFGEFIPAILQRVIKIERASRAMLLDPATHISNRAGFVRDLERDLDKARRKSGSVSVVILRLCGIESMGNLSQRHLQEHFLRQVAVLLSGTLRASDCMARLGPVTFAASLVDVEPKMVTEIANRIQSDLNGSLIDDGIGAVVEIVACAGYTTLNVDKEVSESNTLLARMIIETATEAANCLYANDGPVRYADVEL
ncbi:GGDEF domain protein [Luminiphilus syltensis NOR5-1B]|uniref:GGDEF domain protein n=1 Tax=Luminiphilus syltensis NOR5-1B TaxID=565045 RepID=B8KQN2_9GAMM|nr:GGDEF domain-containing protein [Luminiphilus syltensis]EED35295.1 GGDEF domain protein [Luminiphilus syltensis NOR5-1B]